MNPRSPLLALALGFAAFSPALPAQTYTFSTIPGALYNSGGIAVDPTGAIYTSSLYSGYVVKTSPAGAELARYGVAYSGGSSDGAGSVARFNTPQGLALDSAGNLYVADTGNHTVRKISPAGVVSTLAGLAQNAGRTDGSGTAARFNAPRAVAVDATGTVYVADSGNHTIRKITPAGEVTTLAGTAGIGGSVDATGAAARFSTPAGLAVDSAGNLFVADYANHTVRRITPAGAVSTVAGLAGSHGRVDAAGPLARFFYPQGVAVDSAGNLFVADASNYAIRRVTAAGVVTTLGGLAGVSGEASGVGASARFYGPRALTVTNGGDLYLADAGSTRLGVSSGQLAITVQPQAMTLGIGSTARLTVTATGAAPLTYQWQKDGAPIFGATQSALTLASVSSLAVGTYTVTATNPLGSLASTGAALAIVAAVPNDDFAAATILTGATGSANGTNNGATGEPDEPTHHVPSAAASSIWYRWTAPETGTAVFSISANFSTAQVAWTGTALADLTRAASTSGSRLSFRAVSGTTYYLALGSNGTARGNLTLSWRILPNDDFAGALPLSGNSGTVTANNDGASNEPGEPRNPLPPTASLWYRWTPTQTGTATLDVTSGWTCRLYTGTALGDLARLTPDEVTTVSGSLERRIVNVQAGTTYWIAAGTQSYAVGSFSFSYQIAFTPYIYFAGSNRSASVGSSVTFSVGYVSNFSPGVQWFRDGRPILGATDTTLRLDNIQSGDAGSYTVRIDNGQSAATATAGTLTVLVPPANDNFAAAVAMNGLSGRLTGTNVNASGEPSEPAHWNLSGTASSVWYRWTPSAGGLAAIDTVGSDFDTVLAVYTGPAAATVANLTRLTQDDDRGGGRTSLVSFAAVANTTYYIAIGGATSSARGNVVLNWQLTPVLAVATPPASQTVVAGGSATLSVTATGAGVTYQWNRNGAPIPGATQSTLTVTNLAPGSDAAFTVTLTNSSGSVTSAPATITVSAPATTAFSLRHPGRSDVGMLWSIAAHGDTLVACGDGGAILSSSDNGRTWAPRLAGNTAWLVAVTYGGGQFVIVGEGGRILTSADGITWTAVTATGTTERLNNVLFADGRYVAIGERGACVTSPDARVWTPRTTPVNTWLHGLAYHAGIKQFAASGENAVFLVSADAITWTRLPVAGYTGHLHHIAAVDSYAHFVTVGDQGKAVSVRQNQVVLKDGQPLTTWSADVASTNLTKTLIGLVQAAGALYAMSEDGQVITATSDRGPWSLIDTPTRSTDGRHHFLNAGIFQNDTIFIVGQFQTVLQSEPLFTSRLRNISTRGEVGTGGNIMISGFIVRGDRPKSVLVRAAGPALGAFGVPGTLAAPVLSVLDSRATVVASNAGWTTAANAAAITATAARVSAFPFAAGSADAALLATLSPGEYTAQVSGANGTTGICLVEVYDTDVIANTGSHAVNISTRGLSGAGSSKMIAGFIIEGAAARRVLIRAVGPGLAQFGVAGTLAEPTLEIYNSRGLLHATAGAWGLQSNADEIRGAFASGGAFALAEGSKDAAMVLALPPGSWTVQVGGATTATGVALIEVYTLP